MLMIFDTSGQIKGNHNINDWDSETLVRRCLVITQRARVTFGLFVLNKLFVLGFLIGMFSYTGLHVAPIIIALFVLWMDLIYVVNKLEETWYKSQIFSFKNILNGKLFWFVSNPIWVVSKTKLENDDNLLSQNDAICIGATKTATWDDGDNYHVYAVKDEKTVMLLKLSQ